MGLAAIIAGALLLAQPGGSGSTETTPARTASGEAAAPRPVRIEVTLLLNGAPGGEVPVETTSSGAAPVRVETEALTARLQGIAAPSLLDRLRARAAGRAWTPIDELGEEGVRIAFDSSALQLRLDIPIDAQRERRLSVTNPYSPPEAPATNPSDLAIGMSLTLAGRFHSGGGFRTMTREPFTLTSRGFVNLGGKEGAYFAFLGGVHERSGAFRRRTTLFHDRPDSAIRYAAGDIDPLTSGTFSSPVNILGIGVERLYQTLQPYRNLRPAGRGALVLERASRVEIYANGALYRTLPLGPGRYALRDFPFLDGLNDVRLAVRDDMGRDESIDLSFFSDTDLLAPGLSVFSAVLGFRQDYSSARSSSRYARSPMFSGLYQRGFADWLTAGASLQADRHDLLAAGQAVIATPFGILNVEAAVDRSDKEPLQGALALGYRLSGGRSDVHQDRLDIDVQLQSARFSPMREAGSYRNPYILDIAARYQRALAFGLYGSFGLGYAKARDGRRDLKTLGAGVSRPFRGINATLNYSYRGDARGTDHRAVLSLSLSLSDRQHARLSYDTGRQRAGLDYVLHGYGALDETTARVSLARDPSTRFANVEVEHLSNRLRGAVRIDYASEGGFARQTADIVASTGIGYADGSWAIGRDPDAGFVIVRPHRTLKGAGLTVSRRYGRGPSARSGLLGPALVPLQRPYQRDSLEIEVPDLRPGYDLGAGRLDIHPGAGSGYLWTLGSAASNTAIGRIVNGRGEPVPLLAGTLKPVAGKDAREAPFFTNRAGRLVAQRLAPGRYGLVPAGSQRALAIVDIAEDASGQVDLGTLRIEE